MSRRRMVELHFSLLQVWSSKTTGSHEMTVTAVEFHIQVLDLMTFCFKIEELGVVDAFWFV